MFAEDRSLVDEEVLDPQVMRILRVVHYTGFRLPDGRTAFGYDMRDGTYLLVESTEGLEAGAKQPVWRASHLNSSGAGFRCTELQDLHNALVQSFKLPSPVLDIDHGRQVVDADVADEIAALQEIERAKENASAPAMAM